ncbi:hypothetical protein [Spiroplasma taiwanense]|uniref:Uncharacterized protein n=1 Tax=Spiroplasma taiwanense CT-1 TaxID=1276220 RepID=S5MIH4_9MOLU|nr:hypothetical protein [Spiroplasma taiwanense]AGR41695.1 hypothetical protein STAIW_v1c11120 [Spiroplasma taiwanense CT-1]
MIENNFTILLDPDNEFLNISKNLEANMIDLAALNQILNPFDVVAPVVQDEVYLSFEEKKNWFLEEHLNKLKEFHELLFPDWIQDKQIFLTKLIKKLL